MKKIFISIATAAVMSVSLFSFAACNETTDELIHSARVESTCTKEGHAEYWTDGVKYFTDADGVNEVSYDTLKISKKDHTPASGWSSNANGHYHACTVCQNPADTEEEHTLGSWVYIIPPSASTAGQGYKVCSVCLYQTPNGTIPPSGATASLVEIPAREPTCLATGNIRYWTDGVNYYTDADGDHETTLQAVTVAKLSHSLAAAWSTDNDDHWHMCTDTSVTEHEAGDRGGHNFKWVTDQTASETIPGVKHEECITCHKTQNENTPIPATGVITHHDYSAATCGEDGNIEYWEKGGNYYSDAQCTVPIVGEVVIPATGEHQEESAWQSDNENHWHKCSVCEKKIESTEGGHDFKWVTDQTAGETNPGVKHEECITCHRTQNENTPIPATGVITHHDYSAATCGEDGNIEYWEKGGNYYSDAQCTVPIVGEVVIPATGEHQAESAWQTGDGKHWHNCSVCGNKIASTESVHVHTETVVPPTCTENGYTKHECECGDSYNTAETPASGHSFTGNKTEFDTTDNKFYRVCDNCGTRGSVVGHFGNRYVKINDTTYEVADCYAPENLERGITYDPINQEFTIHITDNYSDALKIATRDDHVILSVEEDTVLSSLTFSDEWGDNHNLKIVGTNKLTVNSSISIATALTLTIESSFTVKGDLTASLILLEGTTTVYGKLYVRNLTVGDVDGESSPVLNIKGAGITNEIPYVGSAVVNYQILSGTVNIQKNADNAWTGIDVKGSEAESVIYVGQHATLNIKGFNHGIAYAADDGKLEIAGNVNIIATENCTNKVNVTVDGGNFTIFADQWGITGGSVKLVSGKATLIKNVSGFAALNGISSLSVDAGFDFGIKGFNQIIFGSSLNNDTFKVEATITTELGGNETQNALFDGKTADGTVTPSTLEIDDIPSEE